jgi:hypothetical protein
VHVAVLVARDRQKATVSKITCLGRIVKEKLDMVIGGKLTLTNILVSDAWRAYKTYAEEKDLEHYRLKSKEQHTIRGKM